MPLTHAVAVVATRLAVLAALLAPLVVAPAPARAAEREYRLAPNLSRLGFSYTEDGAPQKGRFTRFDATGRIDPTAPATAALTLTIATASVDLDDAFRTAFVQGAGWFDSATFPDAVYQLDGLIRLRGDEYIAVGTLTIKGVAKRVSAPLRLSFDGPRARAVGDLTFDRRDFQVGGGPEELFVEVGDKITVAFDLSAAATP